MTIKTKRSVVKYAQALIKNGFYHTKKEARQESIRWHNKALEGLVESLKCYPSPHPPKIEVTYRYS